MIITKIFTFDSAHQLDWHQGKCKNIHGHTYKLEVSVKEELDKNGVVMDFGNLKKIVKQKVIDKYDHKYLNEKFTNPTAEIVITKIWQILQEEALNLHELKLWETPTCYVTMKENE